MLKNDKSRKYMSDAEKQRTPLRGEVSPQDGFTKLAGAAIKAAGKYGLKGFTVKPEK